MNEVKKSAANQQGKTQPSYHDIIDEYEEVLPLPEDSQLPPEAGDPYYYGLPEEPPEAGDPYYYGLPEEPENTQAAGADTKKAPPKKEPEAPENTQADCADTKKAPPEKEPEAPENTQADCAEPEKAAQGSEAEDSEWYVPLSDVYNTPIPDYVASAANVRAVEHKFLLGDARFPIGEISIIAGTGGTGKGQLAAAHIAHASRGYNLAGEKAGVPQRCLFISAEDTSQDVRRRLERSKFKADYKKIFIIDKVASNDHPLDLSDGYSSQLLMTWISTTGASLVYIDPLQAFVGDYTDLSRQNHVRRVMHLLSTIAERWGCCIVLLMHLNKRQSIVSAADLLCGSSDIVNASRSAMLLSNDFKDGDPDRRYLFHIKSNHARNADTLEINISSDGNSIVGKSELTPEDYVMAINSRKAAKGKKGEVDYEGLFYSGVERMIAEGVYQMTFKEFVGKYAQGFIGRVKCVLDDITPRVEERFMYTIQTMTSGSCPVKISAERGFRLVKLS